MATKCVFWIAFAAGAVLACCSSIIWGISGETAIGNAIGHLSSPGAALLLAFMIVVPVPAFHDIFGSDGVWWSVFFVAAANGAFYGGVAVGLRKAWRKLR